MVQQTTRRRGASNPFKVEAARIADDHGGNRRRIEAGLRHIAESFQINPAKSEDPSSFFQDVPFNLFLNGIETTSVDAVLSAISAVDPVTIAKREVALKFLFRRQTPLYAIDQLTLRLSSFVEYLRQHRDFLMHHGLPPRMFRRCRWLYTQLGRLYDTKRTAASGPLNEYLSRSQRLQFQQQQPYCWLKMVPRNVSPIPGHPVPSIGYGESSYDDASLLRGLDLKDAARLEEARPKLLELKISILEMLATLLNRRAPDEIWPQAVRRITNMLLADEADFLLRMDRFYMGLDARHNGATDVRHNMIPGGLTNLFEVIGHCEKELRLENLAATTESLQTAFPSLSLQRLLRETVSSTTAPYFVITAHGGHPRLDQILDKFTADAGTEQEFWAGYRRRINSSLLNDFYAEVVVRQRIKRPLAEKFTSDLTSFAGYAATMLNAGNPLRLDFTDKVDNESRQFVFIHKGKLWEVGDSSAPSHVPDLKGFKYIAELLRKPGRAFHVAELDALVNPPTSVTQGERSSADLNDSQGTTGIPINDHRALQEYYVEANTLRSEIDEAKRSNDSAGETRAEEKLNELLSLIRTSININGNSREFSNQHERLRKSIRKCVEKAIERIQPVNHLLGSHLLGAISLGMYCEYNPLPIRVWTLD